MWNYQLATTKFRKTKIRIGIGIGIGIEIGIKIRVGIRDRIWILEWSGKKVSQKCSTDQSFIFSKWLFTKSIFQEFTGLGERETTVYIRKSNEIYYSRITCHFPENVNTKLSAFFTVTCHFGMFSLEIGRFDQICIFS